MLYREISRVLGRYFLYLAAILLIPLSVSFLYEFLIEKKIYFQTPATFAFLEAIGISLFASLFFRYLSRKSVGRLYRKESILLVALIWFFTAGIGALPFMLTKVIENPVDAYFESMSGLTTTGATIIHPKAYTDGKEIPLTVQNPLEPVVQYTFYGTVPPLIDPATGVVLKTGVEALGKPLLFWRAFLQWLGGMGIVVLFIAVLPALAMGGKFLFESEMAGPTKEGMTPRIKETAGLLWKIYLFLTFAQIGLLVFTNPQMPFFDAATISFSTISTGGFAVRNNGLDAYHTFHTEWIIALFMLLGSLNFTLYFHMLKGKIYRLYEPEFFFYLLTLIGSCALMSWGLWNTPKFGSNEYFTFTEALSTGSFQAISSQTSTGFSVANYDLWPFACQILMIILMFVGGMSGSTTGGIKIIRYTILIRLIKNKIESLFRPEAVRCLKVGEKEIPDKMGMTVLIFFCIVIATTIFGTYLLVLDNIDPITSMGTIACMLNNTGLSIGGIGSTGSFAFLSDFSKIVSIFSMALGRLEYFTLLVLFVPEFWRNR